LIVLDKHGRLHRIYIGRVPDPQIAQNNGDSGADNDPGNILEIFEYKFPRAYFPG
jgi:hypothetical protein